MIRFLKVFLCFTVFLAMGNSYADVVFKNNFYVGYEDRNIKSDLDYQDLFLNIKSMAHIKYGKVRRIFLTITPMTYGTDKNLQLEFFSENKHITVLGHHEFGSTDITQLPKIYFKTSKENPYFEECEKRNFINIKYQEKSCTGIIKSISFNFPIHVGPSIYPDGLGIEKLIVDHLRLFQIGEEGKMLLKKALILPGHNLSTPKEGSAFHLAFLDFKNIPTLSHCSPENPQGLTFDCQKRMSESFTKENLKKRRQAQLVFQAREENQHTEIIMSEKSFIDANDLIWPNLKIDNISIENKPVNQTNSKFIEPDHLDFDTTLNIGNYCVPTGKYREKYGVLHQIGNKVIQIDYPLKNNTYGTGYCINSNFENEKEYELTPIIAYCNSDGHIEKFFTDPDSPIQNKECTDFSTGDSDMYDCRSFGFEKTNGQTPINIERTNLTHFEFKDKDNVTKKIFFEMLEGDGGLIWGARELEKIIQDDLKNEIHNFQITDNPLGMFYATCKAAEHFNTDISPPSNESDVCIWKTPNSPECYGKYNLSLWAKYKKTPMSFGPLKDSPVGYQESNFFSAHNEAIFKIYPELYKGRGFFHIGIPERYNTFWETRDKTQTTDTIFGNGQDFDTFRQYSEGVAASDYQALFLGTTNNHILTNTFKRVFYGRGAYHLYRIDSSKKNDANFLCTSATANDDGKGCKNIILSGDVNDCATGLPDTEIYCLPPKMKIFFENNSHIHHPDVTKIFTFDGYDSIKIKDLDLTILPSGIFSMNRKTFLDIKTSATLTDTQKYEAAKDIVLNKLFPSSEHNLSARHNSTINHGDMIIQNENNMLVDQPLTNLNQSIIEANGLTIFQFYWLASYFGPGSSAISSYGDLSSYFYTYNGSADETTFFCNSATNITVSGNQASGLSYQILDNYIDTCFNTGSSTVIDDRFFYYFLDKLYERYDLDKELHSIGGVFQVRDSKSVSFSNVKIKTVMEEYAISAEANFVDVHGVKIEGVSADELISYGFPLDDTEIGVADLIYFNEPTQQESMITNVYGLDCSTLNILGEPTCLSSNIHPENSTAQTKEELYFLGGGIHVANYTNKSESNNSYPSVDLEVQIPYLMNPCYDGLGNLVSPSINSFCTEHGAIEDLLFVPFARSSLNNFQLYSPFYSPPEPTEFTQKPDYPLDGADYINRARCAYLAADRDSPFCDRTLTSTTCSSGFSCEKHPLTHSTNPEGFCVKTCITNSDCGEAETCIQAQCTSAACDNTFSSISNSTIKNATRLSSTKYITDGTSTRVFNVDGIVLRSTSGIIFNSEIENYAHDAGYDLNHRGLSSEDFNRKNEIQVKRNLFKNMNTKHTGTDYPWHKIIYSNNLYFNTYVGGYFTLQTPYWVHNSFIFPGDVSGPGYNFNRFGKKGMIKEDSSSEYFDWHEPFGRRINFWNNSVITGRDDQILLQFYKNKKNRIGETFRMSGNLFWGDFPILYSNKASDVENIASETWVNLGWINSFSNYTNDPNDLTPFNAFYNSTDAEISYQGLQIVDVYFTNHLMKFLTNDDDPLLDEDINNRFDLIKWCQVQANNLIGISASSTTFSPSYRCMAGDLTSKFFKRNIFGESVFKKFYGETSAIDGGDAAQASDNQEELINFFNPNSIFSSGELCGSVMDKNFTGHKVGGMINGDRLFHFERDFNGVYRKVKSSTGAFELLRLTHCEK